MSLTNPDTTCFSALQRAENSSMSYTEKKQSPSQEFQCSSASRKFLNENRYAECANTTRGFSALQRAENSSMK